MISEKGEFGFTYGGREYKFEAVAGKYEVAPELTVEVVRREMPEFDAAHWTLWFSNPSKKNSEVLSDIHDCDMLIPMKKTRQEFAFIAEPGERCVTARCGILNSRPWNLVYRNNGPTCAYEFRPVDDYFVPFESVKKYENLEGRSSAGHMPFFDVHAGDKGTMIAIGWTGGWHAVFSSVEAGVEVKTGLKDAHFYLEPGEKVRTSSVLLMDYDGEKVNKFRRLMAKYFSHKANRPNVRDGMFAANVWGALPSNKMLERIDEYEKADVPFDDLWIDAGWYGDVKNDCIDEFVGNWWSYTGDWRVSPNIHPDGLREVRDRLKKSGKRIMLWFEPERLTDIAIGRVDALKKHPEWLLKSKSPDSRNSYLYYGAPGAVDYVFGEISALVEDLNISCYRQDFNTREMLDVFRSYEDEDRIGIHEIKHITGMYELFDRINALFPDIIIDNCASGGTRIDIEMLSRSVPFWRTDYMCYFNYNPEYIQTQSASIATILPFSGGSLRGETDVYVARSAYSSNFGMANYCIASQTMTDEQFKVLSRIAHDYLKVRPFFSKDFYNHGSKGEDPAAWAVWQYHDPETGCGAVLAFRRPESPFDNVTITLGGVPQNSKLDFESLDDQKPFTTASNALTITLPQKRSSTILLYKPQK